MAWQPEDLSSQIDGSNRFFTTTFQRRLGQLVVYHNESLLLASQYTEPNNKQVETLFTPQVGDSLVVTYLTDETVDGRVVGLTVDPNSLPPPAIPQSLQDTLDALDDRIDVVEEGLKEKDPKDSVRVATTANIAGNYDNAGGVTGRGRFTLMPNVVDSIPLASGDRILVKDQSSGDQNGIWAVVNPGAGADGVWERDAGFDEDSEVSTGARVAVITGPVNGKTQWVLITPDPITIGGPGGTALTWSQIAGSGGGVNRIEQTFTPTLGQTIFNLISTPVNPNDVDVYVNTVKYRYGFDYTVAGSLVTWLNTQFSLDTQDTVEIFYFV